MKRFCAILACALAGLLVGCGGGQESSESPGRPWRAFVRDLTNTLLFAEMDRPNARLISSYDRTGGNEDYNHFVGEGSEPGWVVLAEVEGPGCIRRFWCTGMDPDHPIRIYFDGEETPRIEGEVRELFGYTYPFEIPLARDINLCYWTYIPLTFRESIRIETKGPPTHPLYGKRRLYHQFNVQTFPASEPVQTFPREFTPEDRAAVDDVASVWARAVLPEKPDWAGVDPVRIEPGGTGILYRADSASVLREWAIDVRPAEPDGWTQQEKESILQNCLLRMRYNGEAEPSLNTPVGDFFCNAWRRRHFASLPVSSTPSGYRSRFPVPFETSAEISLLNRLDKPVEVSFRVLAEGPWREGLGYLHTHWSKSGPESAALHPLLQAYGKGHVAGCFLATTGHDNSWWLLEGDERMFADGEQTPSWHGTGLEDYFNGGWYYARAAFAPFHGVMDHAPFRAAQYRFQMVDPATFSEQMMMDIERGDQNVSKGYFRSLTWYYLDRPHAAVDPLASGASLDAAVHPEFKETLMLQLFQLERMNNFQKAIDLLREYAERYPDDPANDVYALRELEYRRLMGEDIGPEDYEPFLDGTFGESAQQQARLLAWFYEQPDRAIVGMNVNGQGQAWLDGRPILKGDHPYAFFATGVELTKGRHLLAARASMTRKKPWMLLSVRTHNGLTGTGPGTQTSRRPTEGWQTEAEPIPSWATLRGRRMPRGVPDAPYLGSMANAFVLQQSKIYAVRPEDWGHDRNPWAYCRILFDVPLDGLPDTAWIMTGLKE